MTRQGAVATKLLEVGMLLSEEAILFLLGGDGVVVEQNDQFWEVVSIPSSDCIELTKAVVSIRLERGRPKVIFSRCKECKLDCTAR